MKKIIGMTLMITTLLACTNMNSTQENNSITSSEQIEIGILQYMEHESLTAVKEGFIEEMQTAGYTDGQNITITVKNAHGEQANLQTISEQLLKNSDVILAIATPAAQSVANYSTETPIVFSAVTDPISAGLVETLETPGGLVTGISDQAPIEKQVELLQQAVPDAKRVGILYSANERNSEVQVEHAQRLLEDAGLEVVLKTVTTTNDVQDATKSLMKDVDVVFVPTDNTVASTMTLIGELSIEHKVPVIGGSQEMVQTGGLLTYGTNYKSLGRQTARQVIKIIEGADVATLPVEFPSELELHINQEMADALQIDVSKLAVE